MKKLYEKNELTFYKENHKETVMNYGKGENYAENRTFVKNVWE